VGLNTTLALVQVAAGPAWVGPTVAISLAVIALSILTVAIALAMAALRLSAQARRIGAVAEDLEDDAAQALKAVRRLTEQGQDLMVLVRHEAGAIAQTSRRVRRKVTRGVDRVEGKLNDLETLYDLVHGEVEDTALDVAAALRSVRRGNGMLGRVRRLLVAGRR
jgi:methyl-accepting chemotaxis protein